MILVDTSIWIDHLRQADRRLAGLLDAARVLTHPFIIGELALGHVRSRAQVLANLKNLPATAIAGDDEVLSFIDSAKLAASGIGYLDAHLLASVTLTPGAKLWTRDRKLADAAMKLGVAM